jgi:hypothetical protein
MRTGVLGTEMYVDNSFALAGGHQITSLCDTGSESGADTLMCHLSCQVLVSGESKEEQALSG